MLPAFAFAVVFTGLPHRFTAFETEMASATPAGKMVVLPLLDDALPAEAAGYPLLHLIHVNTACL